MWNEPKLVMWHDTRAYAFEMLNDKFVITLNINFPNSNGRYWSVVKIYKLQT